VFGVGLPELAVIALVAIIVFGPEKMPEYARQAGRMVRELRRFVERARDDIRNELGPEYANFELTDLDPRAAIRKQLQDAWDGTDDEPARPGLRPLERGERPPYDVDAT
jgi:sec-independent protein translocase protein TatB